MKPAGVRIGSGDLKGRRLEVPAGIRPSEGKVKAALFSIWSAELAGASFLDLFAGSGAVGVEAVSRGALSATFVESDRRVLPRLRRNLAHLPAGAATLHAGDAEAALSALHAAGSRFELVFADPPYSRHPDEALLELCSRVLESGGKLAFEHGSRVRLPMETGDLVRIESRRYGESALTFYGRP